MRGESASRVLPLLGVFLVSGAALYLDSTAKDRHAFGIRFPVGRGGSGHPATSETGEPGSTRPEPRAAVGGELVFLGTEDGESLRVPVSVARPVEAALGEQDGILVDELRVHLAYSADSLRAVGTQAGRRISIGLETVESKGKPGGFGEASEASGFHAATHGSGSFGLTGGSGAGGHGGGGGRGGGGGAGTDPRAQPIHGRGDDVPGGRHDREPRPPVRARRSFRSPLRWNESHAERPCWVATVTSSRGTSMPFALIPTKARRTVWPLSAEAEQAVS